MSQSRLGEGMKLLSLGRGNPYFMLMWSLPSTEWRDRGKRAEGPGGLKTLVPN